MVALKALPYRPRSYTRRYSVALSSPVPISSRKRALRPPRSISAMDTRLRSPPLMPLRERERV